MPGGAAKRQVSDGLGHAEPIRSAKRALIEFPDHISSVDVVNPETTVSGGFFGACRRTLRQLCPEDSSEPAGVKKVAVMPSPRRYTNSTPVMARSSNKVYAPGCKRVSFQ